MKIRKVPKSRFSPGWMIALLSLMTSCGQRHTSPSTVSGLRDNSSLLLVENSFESADDGYDKVPGEVLNFILMTDRSDPSSPRKKAYAIDCRGLNIGEVAKAFGIDAKTPYATELTVAQLKQQFEIEKQPILRCSSLLPGTNPQAISQVFQLIEDRKADAGSVTRYPDLLIRFSRLLSVDTADQNRLYSVGCRDILNQFGSLGQANLSSAVPVLASSLAAIFGDTVKQMPNGNVEFDPLNCMSHTQPPLLDQPSKKLSDLPERKSQDLSSGTLQFIKVVDSQNTSSVVTYLAGTDDNYLWLKCPNVGEANLKAALRFPAAYAAIEMKSNDPRYLDARRRGGIECGNPLNDDRYERKLVTVREVPAVNYYKKKDALTLYRFGCSSVEQMFTEGLKTIPSFDITYQTVDFFKSGAPGAVKVIEVPCFGWDLTPQIRDAFFDVVGRSITPGELSYWLDTYKNYQGSAQAFPETFRTELGQRLVHSQVSTTDPNYLAAIEAIRNAISNGKTNNAFKPGVDQGGIFFEERDFFRRFVFVQKAQPEALKVGLYRYMQKWIAETGMPSRYDFIRAYRKTMACDLDQIGISCPTQSTFQDYTDEFFNSRGRNWTETSVIQKIEEHLMACARTLKHNGPKDGCYYDVETMVDNACRSRPDICGSDFWDDSGDNGWKRRFLLANEMDPSTKQYINYYAKGAIRPNVQSVLCYLQTYKDCPYSTSANSPWRNPAFDRNIRSDMVYWPDESGHATVGSVTADGMFVNGSVESKNEGWLYYLNYGMRLKAGTDAVAVFQISSSQYDGNDDQMLTLDVYPSGSNQALGTTYLSRKKIPQYGIPENYRIWFKAPSDNIYEPRVYWRKAPGAIQLHQVVINSYQP